MSDNVLCSNEFFILTEDGNDLYLETIKKGLHLDMLLEAFHSHPEIEITNLNALKNSVNAAPMPPQKIGRKKDKISIEILDNDMKVIVVFNLNPEELDIKSRNKLSVELMEILKRNGVVLGVKSSVLEGELQSGKRYVIAEGIPPVNGHDCIIKMYELKDTKPEVNQDGSVDFYDLKLINSVKAGDWLGERIDATEGIPGKTVKGESVNAEKGKNYSLNYDKTNITEISDGNKTTLYSKIDGAVNYNDGRITISNHLEYVGDVDFSTGNVNFDGFVSVKGTVADGFSIIATKDIEINSELGIGNVKEIVSTQGSIYIRGGIVSKGRAIIRAAKNVYTKFADNAEISAGESVHIGFYCINSIIDARELVLDSSKGRIIGGSIKVEIRVSSPVIGSEMERKTIIEVTGFDRNYMKSELEETTNKLAGMKTKQQQLKLMISHYGDISQLNPFQKKEYTEQVQKMYSLKNEMKELEEKRKNCNYYMKTHGDGEICIGKKVFPNSILIIKKNFIDISAPMMATTFYIQDGEIKQANN
jgi:uncharacterized protein (DUF342 family)